MSVDLEDTFDQEMILTLIEWAQHDLDDLTAPVTWRERFTALAGWGHWGQSTWSQKHVRQPMTIEQATESLNGVCQTSFCMAGQTVAQHGYRLIYTRSQGSPAIAGLVLKPGTVLTADYCIRREATGVNVETGVVTYRDDPDAEPQLISEVAERLLGLSAGEAARFFDGDNSLRDLKEMANSMFADRYLAPPFPDYGYYDPSSDEDEDEDENDY